jgi:hypothetical protein
MLCGITFGLGFSLGMIGVGCGGSAIVLGYFWGGNYCCYEVFVEVLNNCVFSLEGRNCYC